MLSGWEREQELARGTEARGGSTRLRQLRRYDSCSASQRMDGIEARLSISPTLSDILFEAVSADLKLISRTPAADSINRVRCSRVILSLFSYLPFVNEHTELTSFVSALKDSCMRGRDLSSTGECSKA